MSKQKLFFLSLLSGVLLSLAWPERGFAALLFVAFVPLLIAEDAISYDPRYKPHHAFLFSFAAFLFWNVYTTFWIWNSTEWGSIVAMGSNAGFMAIVFWLFHITKKKLGERFGYFSLVCYWFAFEYLHLQWELSWPWLTLGNGFSAAYKWVQWYEYTGVFGGGLWIFLANILFFLWLKGPRSGKALVGILSLIILPILLSYVIYIGRDASVTTPPTNIDVVVVQPNIDPYTEKFAGEERSIPYDEQIRMMLALAEKKIDTATDYAVFPETAISEVVWENDLEMNESIRILRDFLKKYPHLKIVIGASSGKVYAPGEKLSETARKHEGSDQYYDYYNTAFQLDSSGKIQTYHKSKLVPGVERMPYPKIFGFLEGLAIRLGGSSGSLGTQDERSVFECRDKCNKEHICAAPVICYESIYGEYISEYIRKGANFIFIITNDGWWGNTSGYRQHLTYASLRAIETRREIARSANTGISCFVNMRGDIQQPTGWWTQAVTRSGLRPNSELTFYVRHGDYIAHAAIVLAGLIFCWFIIKRRK